MITTEITWYRPDEKLEEGLCYFSVHGELIKGHFEIETKLFISDDWGDEFDIDCVDYWGYLDLPDFKL